MKMLREHLCALAAVVLFGLMSPASKYALSSGLLDGLALGVLRLWGAAAAFTLLALATGALPRIGKGDRASVVGMALSGMVFNQCLYVTGIQFTSPVNACVIGSVTPVAVLVLSCLFLGARLAFRTVAGVGLALAGALTLVLGSAATGGRAGSPFGDLLCVLSQTSAACYFVFFGRTIRRYPPVGLLAWVFLAASALVSPLAVWKANLLAAAFSDPSVACAVAYVVFGGTFAAYLFLIVAQRRLEPAVVATYNYVQPVVAAAAGLALSLELLTWQKCLAGVLIACGVWLVTHSGGHSPSLP